MTTNATKWLRTPDELDSERDKFLRGYFDSGEIFQTPHGAGYWLYGVEHHPLRGWLAFEYDEADFDSSDEEQHAEAISAWQNGEPLPPNYYAITPDVSNQVFDNYLRRWGESGLDDLDLPSVEESLQFTILGEVRYG